MGHVAAAPCWEWGTLGARLLLCTRHGLDGVGILGWRKENASGVGDCCLVALSPVPCPRAVFQQPHALKVPLARRALGTVQLLCRGSIAVLVSWWGGGCPGPLMRVSGQKSGSVRIRIEVPSVSVTVPSTHPWGHNVTGDQQEGSALLFLFFFLFDWVVLVVGFGSFFFFSWF